VLPSTLPIADLPCFTGWPIRLPRSPASRDAGEGCGPRAAAHLRRLSTGRLSPGRATAVGGIGGVRFSSHSRSGGRESGNVSRNIDGAHAPLVQLGRPPAGVSGAGQQSACHLLTPGGSGVGAHDPALFSEPPAPARPTGRCSRTALSRTNFWSPRQNTVIGRKFTPSPGATPQSPPSLARAVGAVTSGA
jgi:hypothetical protein